ncbi:hypothetical protein PSTG_07498 [Puccinia striiformis f. sp. tritici PST-78]|uniref:Uncharacterized protein n=1 Tax=Puccinia striiformis f. sp. tritici PST-78 TaxID=1165861 RepID=A0A0L0VIS4_9BASI|nr:hypothetical protein PSTG_07498 [Puccinia striiformis f. sp. tritici PST-78]
MEKSENGQQEAQEQETIKNSPFNSIRLSSDQTEPLDLTTSDLAIALEPFGYGKNQLTGQRSTTLRQLPQILTKFQNSRDTVFFTNDGLKAIGAFAAQNPEYVVENEFLNELLSSARQVNAQPNHPPTENQEQQEESSSSPSHEREAAAEEEGSDHRIRTAESPASSNGDRAGVYYGSNLSSPDQLALDEPEDEFQDRSVGEHSFDSNQERTVVLAEQPQTQPSSSKSSPKRTSRTERHQSVPIGFGDSYQVMKRPQPPNRRKKISSVDLHSHTTTPSKLIQQKRSSSLNRDNNYHTENKLGEDRDNDIQSPELVLGTPFSPTQATPFPSSSEDHDSSTQHLTPNNLSSVIYNNRRRGLYDSMSSANTSNLAEQRPPGSDSSDGNPNDILRRLRSPTSNHFNSQQFLLPHRPTSKTHTSVFESGIGLDGYPTPRSSGASISDLQTMSEEYPILIRSCEELKKKNQEFVNQIQSLEKIHEHEIEKLIEELEELKEELVVVKKSEKELSISSNRLMYQLTNSDDHTTRLNNSIANIESNLHKTKLKWEDAVAESEKLRTQLNQKEDELRSANRHIQSHGSEIKKWELDRQLREEHIKNLHLELEELQATREILEEQKQSNLDLKLTIDRLKFELDEQRLRNAGSSVADSRPTSIAGSSSSSGSSCLSETVLNPAPELPPKEDPEDPDRSSPKTPDPKKTGWAILSSAFQDLSLNGILESLSSSLSLLNPSSHNRLSKEDPNGKALLRRKIRLYTTIIIFLTIIASLIFRSSSSSALSNSGTYKFTNQASSSSSSCILEAIKKSSIDNQDYLLGILSSSSSSPLNASSPSSNINGPGNPSFIKIIHANSLADLIDFNSVALGKEGFFLDYLKSHFQFFVRLTHFGSHMLWSTVSMYQTNPT